MIKTNENDPQFIVPNPPLHYYCGNDNVLQLINPSLEVFQFDYAEIAKSLKIREQEARTEYRHIELNTADGSSGIQITLFDDTASLTIPYWHRGEKASEVSATAIDHLYINARIDRPSDR